MRITRETLLKNARDTIAQRTRTDRGIVAVYLSGSLLEDEFLLGGAADVDLVFVHADRPESERELVRLTDDIHLDIAHHAQRDYRQARTLRLHPWLGPTLNAAKPLYDPQHFLDFTQASVRGQFNRPDNVLARARQQAEHARQIWSAFTDEMPAPGPQAAADYLRAVDHAANAIASLSGAPLTERRFLLNFPARAEAAGHPGLHAGLLGLLGAPHAETDSLRQWLPRWQEAVEALPHEPELLRLAPVRRAYYRHAFDALLDSDQPRAVLWPLLRTWTFAVRHLPEDSPHHQAWMGACEHLGLQGPAFGERLLALDAFLDMVEEALEEWARANGE
jgi:predicted nucleotidyltransferase